MKSSSKLLVFLFCLTLIEGSFRCDYKYSLVAKGWFKYFDVPATWFDARLRCALEGAALASPTTLEIKSEMKNIIKDSNKEIFTGIHATLSQGDYYTVEGTPLSKIPVSWSESEPDNEDNKESCVSFNSDGEVADRRCGDPRPYVCYRPKDPQVEVNECGTVDPEYHLDTRTNKCYKFHKVARKFSRAALACAAEGGHLAIVNSDVEAQALKDLFATIPGKDIMFGMPAVFQDVALIGFYDWGERGDWRTIHGQTLSEAGFSKFNVGEPNGASIGEFCGSIHRSGLLNDLLCDTPCTFICEKSRDEPAVCREDGPSLGRNGG